MERTRGTRCNIAAAEPQMSPVVRCTTLLVDVATESERSTFAARASLLPTLAGAGASSKPLEVVWNSLLRSG